MDMDCTSVFDIWAIMATVLLAVTVAVNVIVPG